MCVVCVCVCVCVCVESAKRTTACLATFKLRVVCDACVCMCVLFVQPHETHHCVLSTLWCMVVFDFSVFTRKTPSNLPFLIQTPNINTVHAARRHEALCLQQGPLESSRVFGRIFDKGRGGQAGKNERSNQHTTHTHTHTHTQSLSLSLSPKKWRTSMISSKGEGQEHLRAGHGRRSL